MYQILEDRLREIKEYLGEDEYERDVDAQKRWASRFDSESETQGTDADQLDKSTELDPEMDDIDAALKRAVETNTAISELDENAIIKEAEMLEDDEADNQEIMKLHEEIQGLQEEEEDALSEQSPLFSEDFEKLYDVDEGPDVVDEEQDENEEEPKKRRSTSSRDKLPSHVVLRRLREEEAKEKTLDGEPNTGF